MRTGFIWKSLVGLWLLVWLPMPLVRAATPVQFTLVRNYLIVVSVRVNDTAADFLLDTGTNTTLLETGFAHQLGLQVKDRLELVTSAGTQIVPRTFLPTLSCGEKTTKNLEVLVADLRAVRSVLPKVRGVLGQNFLSQFNYLVEYQTRRLTFLDAAETNWCGTELPFTMAEGRMLVTTAAGTRLLLDAAISELVLFAKPQAKPELALTDAPLQSMQVQTEAGQRSAQRGILRRLALGNLAFANLAATFLPPAPDEPERLEEGLLPLSLFRTVFVDHTNRRLVLNPQPRVANQSTTPLPYKPQAVPDSD